MTAIDWGGVVPRIFGFRCSAEFGWAIAWRAFALRQLPRPALPGCARAQRVPGYGAARRHGGRNALRRAPPWAARARQPAMLALFTCAELGSRGCLVRADPGSILCGPKRHVIRHAAVGAFTHAHAGLGMPLEVLHMLQGGGADAAGQAEFGVVGQCQRMLIATGRNDGRDRPEDLFTADAHGVVAVGEDRGRHVVARRRAREPSRRRTPGGRLPAGRFPTYIRFLLELLAAGDGPMSEARVYAFLHDHAVDAVQRAPVEKKALCTAHSTATSRSASSSTTMGFLPPISSCTWPCVAPRLAPRGLPVATDPVKEMASTRGSSTMAWPTWDPCPISRLNAPGGSPARLMMLGQGPPQPGRKFRRLEHDRVAIGQGGGDLPGGNGDGKIPRRDDADRDFLAALAQGLAGVELEDIAGAGDFSHAFGQGLAFFSRQDSWRLVAAGEDLTTDAIKAASARVCGLLCAQQPPPHERRRSRRGRVRDGLRVVLDRIVGVGGLRLAMDVALSTQRPAMKFDSCEIQKGAWMRWAQTPGEPSSVTLDSGRWLGTTMRRQGIDLGVLRKGARPLRHWIFLPRKASFEKKEMPRPLTISRLSSRVELQVTLGVSKSQNSANFGETAPCMGKRRFTRTQDSMVAAVGIAEARPYWPVDWRGHNDAGRSATCAITSSPAGGLDRKAENSCAAAGSRSTTANPWPRPRHGPCARPQFVKLAAHFRWKSLRRGADMLQHPFARRVQAYALAGVDRQGSDSAGRAVAYSLGPGRPDSRPLTRLAARSRGIGRHQRMVASTRAPRCPRRPANRSLTSRRRTPLMAAKTASSAAVPRGVDGFGRNRPTRDAAVDAFVGWIVEPCVRLPVDGSRAGQHLTAGAILDIDAAGGDHIAHHLPRHCGLRFCWNASTPFLRILGLQRGDQRGQAQALRVARGTASTAPHHLLMACCRTAARSQQGQSAQRRTASSARRGAPFIDQAHARRFVGGDAAASQAAWPWPGRNGTVFAGTSCRHRAHAADSASGRPKLASPQATTMSQPSTISKPPPSAEPIDTGTDAGLFRVSRSAMPPKAAGRARPSFHPWVDGFFMSAPRRRRVRPRPQHDHAHVIAANSSFGPDPLQLRFGDHVTAVGTSGRDSVTVARFNSRSQVVRSQRFAPVDAAIRRLGPGASQHLVIVLAEPGRRPAQADAGATWWMGLDEPDALAFAIAFDQHLVVEGLRESASASRRSRTGAHRISTPSRRASQCSRAFAGETLRKMACPQRASCGEDCWVRLPIGSGGGQILDPSARSSRAAASP
ncbi:hypothetical protein FQR65_LT17236 [Abscondita terminalis]|nr:hypothetical protein FQR65_LT17236 [Abscondita terminalis]